MLTCLVVTFLERADLLDLVGDVCCIFVSFPCGILGQVWYLIVSFPDLCHLFYFVSFAIFQGIQTCIARKLYFCDFSGGDPDPLPPPPPPPTPLDPRMNIKLILIVAIIHLVLDLSFLLFVFLPFNMFKHCIDFFS